jgi:hypothetical protein
LEFGKRNAHPVTIKKASGLIKPFTRQLAIENVTQAAARNAMCRGVAALDALGYRDVIHVHDEVMLLVRKERAAVLAARDALTKVFGPGHSMPMSWAILIKPEEITLTTSLYENEDDVDPKKGDRWGKIERNEPGCLEGLP